MNTTTSTINETLHFAVIRSVPFAKHLSGANEATLAVMVSWGWLKRIEKAHSRCAWQVTDLGRAAHDGIERVMYEKAIASK